MSYFAFVHSRGGLTCPVFVGEFKGKNPADAYQKAVKHPGVKRIVGNQETGDLSLKIHSAPSLEAAKQDVGLQ